MHIRLISLASLAGLAALGAPPLATASAAPAPTVKVIVRPVTSSGHVASGFTLHAEPTGSVDCSSKFSSPGAVSSNIEACSPSSEYAIACWNSAVAHRALCMRNPRTKNVYRIPRTGAFAATPPPAEPQRAPLLMRLADGDSCSIRDGGAASALARHPNLFATYYCVQAGAVWAGPHSNHLGVNESTASWTVETAQPGNHALVQRRVATAWFVGTHS